MTASASRSRVLPSMTGRELGRALLARQHLLGRHAATAHEEIHHLVGMQSQAPLPPYVGLWTRLVGFTTDDLGGLLTSRRAVRLAAQRSTIHLVTDTDALWLTEQLRPVFVGGLRSGVQHREHVVGLDLDAVAQATLAALATGPLSPAALGAVLAHTWPEIPPATLAQAARAVVPLVQVPPRGLWGASGPGSGTTWAPAHAWLARPRVDLSDPEALQQARAELVVRYLAAFGPATIADAQRWSGLTGLRGVVEGLRAAGSGLGAGAGMGAAEGAVGAAVGADTTGAAEGEGAAVGAGVGAAVSTAAEGLVAFAGPDGREYFDLPDAPRPAADEPAPVRFLPEWDNVLLSHVDRSRIITEERRRMMFSSNGIVAPSVLVDGQVQARWSVVRDADGSATLVVEPLLATLPARARREIASEGMQLLSFVAMDASDHRVLIEGT